MEDVLPLVFFVAAVILVIVVFVKTINSANYKLNKSYAFKSLIECPVSVPSVEIE